MGAHERLIQLGWKFRRETCGCHGAEKKRIYTKGNDQLVYQTKQNLFQINNEPKKPISEIETTTA